MTENPLFLFCSLYMWIFSFFLCFPATSFSRELWKKNYILIQFTTFHHRETLERLTVLYKKLLCKTQHHFSANFFINSSQYWFYPFKNVSVESSVKYNWLNGSSTIRCNISLHFHSWVKIKYSQYANHLGNFLILFLLLSLNHILC